MPAQAERKRASRRDAVNEIKRQLILDAAGKVFAEDGLEKASMRAIAREAGYTAGALYFHYASKEEIYADLLGKSLDRLRRAVEDAVASQSAPADRLRAGARAWFDYYLASPGELDMGFYLFRGMRPRGLSKALDRRLNRELLATLAPAGEALQQLGASEAQARTDMAALFAFMAGTLMLVHTGRIRLFDADGHAMVDDYVDGLLARGADRRTR